MTVTAIFSGDNEAPISELFVFISTDAKGNDGMLSMDIGGVHLPMVTSRKRVADMMRITAARIGVQTGQTIKLIKFTGRQEVETITS